MGGKVFENMDGFRLARVLKINIYQECQKKKNVCRRERACGAEVRAWVPKACISRREPQLVSENPCLLFLLPVNKSTSSRRIFLQKAICNVFQIRYQAL